MTRNVVQHASPVLGNLILFKICTWKILEASVGTTSRTDGKVSLFLDKFVILKRSGGLTEACADGKLTPIFGSRQSAPVAAQSTALFCGRSHAGIASSNHAEGIAVCLSVVNVVCYQAEVSATGRSLVQRIPTECVCVTKCDQVRQ